eukprot:TRINITY_DN3696_c1_g1_i1.p1 TRINITY_DN3696_c1_g1~~TRINITY_DN3696_c1_g1_i1.p1  ORF type:complete len:692 (+),score=182.97 TRINITY_DN3696_c1_g1_i1:211-2286(+)
MQVDDENATPVLAVLQAIDDDDCDDDELDQSLSGGRLRMSLANEPVHAVVGTGPSKRTEVGDQSFVGSMSQIGTVYSEYGNETSGRALVNWLQSRETGLVKRLGVVLAPVTLVTVACLCFVVASQVSTHSSSEDTDLYVTDAYQLHQHLHEIQTFLIANESWGAPLLPDHPVVVGHKRILPLADPPRLALKAEELLAMLQDSIPTSELVLSYGLTVSAMIGRTSRRVSNAMEHFPMSSEQAIPIALNSVVLCERACLLFAGASRGLKMGNIGQSVNLRMLGDNMRRGSCEISGEQPEDIAWLPNATVDQLWNLVQELMVKCSGNIDKAKEESDDRTTTATSMLITVSCGLFVAAALSVFGIRYITKVLDMQQRQLDAELTTRKEVEAAVSMFVPRPFLVLLGFKTLADVRVGHSCMNQITIVFAGVRGFSKLSAGWNSDDIFDWLNRFFGRMIPPIRRKGGFIDKYVGDTIMALFVDAADSVLAAVDMQRELTRLNAKAKVKAQQKNQRVPKVRMGIGIHTGEVCLGTLGDALRVEATIISDAVNLASRLEGLTKYYGCKVIVSETTYSDAEIILAVPMRCLGKVRPKGTTQPVSILDVYAADNPRTIRFKEDTQIDFQKALELYEKKDWAGALKLLRGIKQKQAKYRDVFDDDPPEFLDKAVDTKIEFCESYREKDVPQGWLGEDLWERK